MIADLKPYPEYEESNIPWAPSLPAGWRTERAKWLFTKMQRPVRPEDEVVTCFRDGMVTLRKNRRLRGYTEATAEFGYQGIRNGDLVIHGMDAFAGAIGVSDSDGKGTPVYNVCQPHAGTNARYYAYVVREMSQSQWILALAKGIRERSTDFRFEMFGSQVVPLPPPDEQAAIVRFLELANGRLERTIRAKRKVIALLNEQKQAIIHRAVTRGLDPSVPLKPSGIPWLGDIPQHWEVTALRRHWSVTDCKHLTVPFVEDGIPLASVREVQHFSLDLSRCKRTKPEWYRVLIEGDRHPKSGDLIYCRNVSVGACALVETSIDFAMGQDVCLIRSQSQNQLFLNYVLHSRFMQHQLELLLVGSTFKRINISEIKALAVIVPPRSEQDAICDSLDADMVRYDRTISRLEREIDLLREYRTRLIADVVTGKLDVRQAATQLPDEPIPESDERDIDREDETVTADEEIVA